MASRPLRAIAAVGTACSVFLGALAIFRAAQGQDHHYPAPALIPSGLDPEIKRVEREVDNIEQQALAEWRALPIASSTRMNQVRVLGKLLLFDKNLSVNKNEACSFCHMPDTDFTGPISILNKTTVSYPGSVRYRFGHRKPQSYTYAPFYPVLLYNQSQQDFYGGNFWDLRATGYKLQNPAAEQAQDPPVDPNEMALPDPACAVYRLSQSAYRPLFETVWGAQAFRIQWPPDVERGLQHARSRSRERSLPGSSLQSGPRPIQFDLRSIWIIDRNVRSVASGQPVLVEI